MLYAERDKEGKIISISIHPTENHTEPISEEELAAFIAEGTDSDSLLALISVLDVRIIRVLEDLIDLLIKKNLILFSDLPHHAQQKLAERKIVRKKIQQDPPIIQVEEDLF